MVVVGLAEPAVTNTLPSGMTRLGTSWARQSGQTTDEPGSVPIRAVPHQMAVGAVVDDFGVPGTGFLQ